MSDRDAYEGAREDLLVWKRRALNAEAKVREYDQRIVGIGSVAINSISRESHEAALKDAVAAERAECAGIAAFYCRPATPAVQRVTAQQIADAIMSRGAAHD